MGRPDIVRPDPGDQILDIDVVLRLRHVVEARIVHNRRSVPHLLYPLAVAHLLLRIHRTGFHVVLEAQGVSHFMGAHEFDQLAHQVVRQRQSLGAFVQRTRLQKIPGALQVHDVVIELNIRIQDLARARVVDVRPRRILNGRRQPAYDGIAGVFGREIGILLRRRRQLGNDGILESRSLEALLPLLDARLHVRHPFGGGGRIDPIYDRLDGLGQGGVRVLLFQPPARDVADMGRALLLLPVVHLIGREIPDALVENAGRHGLLGQLHHAVMHHHGGASGLHAGALEGIHGRLRRAGKRRALGVRLRRFHFDIFRVGRNALDIGAGGVHRGRVQALPGAELRHFGGEQARHFYHGGRLFRAECRHGERHYDRIVIRRPHRLRDGQLGVGHNLVIHLAEMHFVAAAFPLHHPVSQSLAAISDAQSSLGDLAYPQIFLAEFGRRNLVIVLVLHLMNGEQAFFRFRILGDYFFIGLRIGRWQGDSRARRHGASRRSRNLGRRRVLRKPDGGKQNRKYGLFH